LIYYLFYFFGPKVEKEGNASEIW